MEKVITPEIIKEDQLVLMVKESGLDQTKADYLLEKFKDAFSIASDWEKKAKSIVVTDVSQTADMQIARIGRLALREKRIEIEKTRKELKEQSLREGKAIDGIANVLKSVIVPIEEYLEKQENYAAHLEAARLEAEKQEAERIAEIERIAKEKEIAAENERNRIENIRLKEEAIERERIAAEAAEKAENEKKHLEEKNRKDKEAAEKKLQAEREEARIATQKEVEKHDALVAAERAKQAKERAEADERARKEREAAENKAEIERAEKERLKEILKNQIECPHCHKTFQLKKV